MNRKKLPATLAAVIFAVAVLLSATFAWQSIEQTALNEASDTVNPGGRLHDDFDGQNKDVYVENFADEPIFARIRLSEFLAFTHNKGVALAEKESVMVGSRDESGNAVFALHIFGKENASDAYWAWKTGGQTVYMPTFNKNKDSLTADVNGTYAGPDGKVTDNREDDRYTDYITRYYNDEKTDVAIYDADANDVDEVGEDMTELTAYVEAGNIVLKEETHYARATLTAKLISMAEFLSLVEKDQGYDAAKHGNYWVYDEDGWVYWSAPIEKDTATGLLLDEINLTGVMDDSWYYAIEVEGQFVTANDTGEADDTGFYVPGTEPTDNAEKLLAYIME